METLRESKRFELIKGTLQARGCFRVKRKKDDKLTLWNTGHEGQEMADMLMSASLDEFDKCCETYEYE